jgi:hypothetical protein
LAEVKTRSPAATRFYGASQSEEKPFTAKAEVREFLERAETEILAWIIHEFAGEKRKGALKD